MIDVSLETGPANEKVRQKLMIPFSFVISPGSLNSSIQTIQEDVQSFPRCQKCGAYFSKYCQKDESKSTWYCDICSHQNVISNEKKDDEQTKIFPEITSDDFQFVKKHQLGEEITVIYISLNFHPKDFKIISNSLVDFLQNSNLTKPIIFLLGRKEHDFTIFAPYKSSYFLDLQNNNIITRIAKDSSEMNTKDELQTNHLPAPIFNLSSAQLSKEDISKFIFSPDQYTNIIKTLEKVSSVPKPAVPFKHFINTIETLQLLIQGKDSSTFNPIHFVSIIPSIDDYFPSRFIRKMYDTLIRIDILTPTYSDEIQDTTQVIPGTVSIFNTGNLSRNISKILLPPFITKSSIEKVKEQHSKFCGYDKRGQGTVYQWNSLARSKGSRTVWRFGKVPNCYEDKGIAFSAVLPSTEQPFVLDIHPDGTSDYVSVQITAKMFSIVEGDDPSFYSSVFRVFNRKIKLSSDVKKIVESINVNTLLWLWITRTLEQSQRDVLAAVYRSTARIIQFLVQDDDDDKNDRDEIDSINGRPNKKIADLVHGVCSLKHSDLMSQDDRLKILSRYSMLLSSPNFFRLIPKYDEKNKVAVFGNSVYYDVITKDDENELNSENDRKSENDDQNQQKDESKTKKIVSIEVLEELMNILFMEKTESPIPDWCKSPDKQTLEFIHSLVSE